MEDRLYVAVVENSPWYFYQAHRLVWSLINEAKVSVEQIILHSIAPVEKMQSFTSMGIRVDQVQKFPNDSMCNKLQQLDNLNKIDFFDAVILDTDIIVFEEPPRSKIKSSQAKPVDFANPPIEMLEKIYKNAGVPWFDAQTEIDKSRTVYANVNGGVYIVHKDFLLEISDRWKYWAHWLVERRSWFRGRHFVDQVSFAMAVAETGLNFEELDRRYNLPVQANNYPEYLDRVPAILHYHGHINDDGTIKTVNGLKLVNKEIERINPELKKLHIQTKEIVNKISLGL